MIAFLLQTFFASGFAFAFSWLYGSLTPTIAVVSLLLGTFIGRRRARGLRRVFPDLRFSAFSRGDSGALEVILSILVIYVSARHFGWMLFRVDSKLITLHANNFGDLPMHIDYIRQMANGLKFPPVNPEFASEPLRYSFGPDLYNALWEILGVPLQSHFFLIGTACACASLVVLRWFGGWWAIGAFFLSGGLSGWSMLQGYAISPDLLAGVEWKNLFLAVFITQRGVLFALPAGLLLIEAYRRILFDGVKPSRGVLTTLGLIWGLLPLFHVHAFVIVSLILGGFAIGRARSVWGLLGLLKSRMAWIAYLPSIYFVLRSSDALRKASILHIDWWWTSEWPQAPWFLLWNFGPWLLLPVALAIVIWRKRRDLLPEFLVYLILFVVFFNVMLAPWSWDNIKVLIFPYLGFARLAWACLDQRLPSFSKYIVAFILFFSGFLAVELSIAPPIIRGQKIYDTPVLGQFEAALAEVPLDAVLATAPTHDHPVTYFGRLRAVGYEGHLWSHGIDYREKLNLLMLLMTKPPVEIVDRKAIAHHLGVTHIVWSQAETLFFKTEPVWPAGFKNISRVPTIEIYEVPK